MKNVLEVKKTTKGNIAQGANVTFNVATPYSDEIDYDPETGVITFLETGRYSVSWWLATETALTGCIQFALESSQGDVILGCSPTKRGQLSGFGTIDVKSDNITMSLVNKGDCPVVLSKTAPVTSSLLAIRIPEDGVIPTFEVDKTETLASGEEATAKVQEDADNPNNWLFSFGIPKGENGDPGATPHIDTGTGNWFISEVDTGVPAQGPTGPQGDVGPCIYAKLSL